MSAPTPTLINLDDSLPAAPGGRQNVQWLASAPFPATIVYQGETISVLARNVSASYANSGSGGSSVAVAVVPLAPGAPGNFTVAHGLGVAPAFVIVQMESGGEIWEQSVPFDSTNLYLTASAGGIVGYATLWLGPADAEIALAPGAPGNFSVPHGLTGTPALALVQMSSGGMIWFQNPTGWDATNLYLDASAGGITGKAEVWKSFPNVTANSKTTIPVTAIYPGPLIVAHGLSSAPEFVLVRMKTAGEIWLQLPPWDSTNIYLESSAAGLQADLEIWTSGAGISGGTTEVIIVSAIAGPPSGSQLVCIFTAVSPVTFAANFAGSYGSVGTNPTATATYTIYRNGSPVGTVSISTGGVFTFTSSGGAGFSMGAGDRLTIVAQTVPDATLADVGISLVGTRPGGGGGGGGSTPTFHDAETPSGTINGSNTVFTLAASPVPGASLQLVLNGIIQTEGADYTLAGNSVTFTVAPSIGSSLIAWYRS